MLVSLDYNIIDIPATTVNEIGKSFGVFETIFFQQHELQNFSRHYQRFYNATARIFKDYQDLEEELLYNAASQFVNAQNIITGALRISLTQSENSNQFHLMMQSRPNRYEPVHYETGLKVVLQACSRNPVNNYDLKIADREEFRIAWHQAQIAGYDDVIFYDDQNRILEASYSNLFVATKNKIYTPPSSLPILPGITRERIFNFCLQNKLPCEEKELFVIDLQNAELAFLCNAITGIIPIAAIPNLASYPVDHLLYKKINNQSLMSL